MSMIVRIEIEAIPNTIANQMPKNKVQSFIIKSMPPIFDFSSSNYANTLTQMVVK